eukprot:scaffold1299_cov246-Pinguiococcus_pyrenoidosus.AAC.14
MQLHAVSDARPPVTRAGCNPLRVLRLRIRVPDVLPKQIVLRLLRENDLLVRLLGKESNPERLSLRCGRLPLDHAKDIFTLRGIVQEEERPQLGPGQSFLHEGIRRRRNRWITRRTPLSLRGAPYMDAAALIQFLASPYAALSFFHGLEGSQID